jgi:hypothetical protein
MKPSDCGDINEFTEFKEGNEARFNDYARCIGRILIPEDPHKEYRDAYQERYREISSHLDREDMGTQEALELANALHKSDKTIKQWLGSNKVEGVTVEALDLEIRKLERLVFI